MSIIDDSNNDEMHDAIILQLFSPNIKEYDLDEFKGLAKSAGYNIIEMISQKTNKINPRYFFGKGKIEIIEDQFNNIKILRKDGKYAKKLEKQQEEDIVFLVNNRLGQNQILALSEYFHTKVVDRDLLILEIFEKNATTHEARLQIKLARLGLETSRKQKELSQKLKSEKQGRDFKGKGYAAIDAYKRAYKEQRKKIMDELIKVRKNRAIQRKSRKWQYNIAIVGYTNAGKTTLMNSLKNSDLKTKDTAFTTVTTVTRRVKYKGDLIIFTDTVGFVYDIPHQIIEAFLSTLEEAAYSDTILLITDLSNSIEEIKQKINTTFIVLAKIGALKVPVVYGFNKIDKISEDELNEKREIITQMLPPNAITFYFSANDKRKVFELVDLLRMVKNNQIINKPNEEFIEGLIQNYNSEIEQSSNPPEEEA